MGQVVVWVSGANAAVAENTLLLGAAWLASVVVAKAKRSLVPVYVSYTANWLVQAAYALGAAASHVPIDSVL